MFKMKYILTKNYVYNENKKSLYNNKKLLNKTFFVQP